ncbi:pilus assembly protein [Qipengyuania sp. 1XM1-15A]|uniref:TadE/TadG family type IV pilus assembly protein n=1 Tax=Qipengyuania xiamenensis TaxID=2867237 RepID=UPI001C870D07|nr:TadE/TadG family type IV pilus assembly protein [Qipengyuania xiamenensis]MBX7531559.1 pilus assembly protein [Qipengyuania xiamenensis]
MALKQFSKMMRRLKADTSGNAMLLVALGTPVLFGSAGLGVDMAQYYLWKREAQYAVDQGALAGAWARGNGDTGSAYKTRARQEFYINLSATKNYLLTHNVELEEWDGTSNNSVYMEATVSAQLPFTKIVIDEGMTIAVEAQATWETTQQFTACLYSLDPTSYRTMWFNGGPTVDAACGVGARSNHDEAIVTNGSSGAQNINWVVAGGGINDGMGAFDNALMVENYEDMIDPWEGLTPPDNPTPRTVNCGDATANWQADERQVDAITFKYYRGQNRTEAKATGEIAYNGAGAQTPFDIEFAINAGALFTAEPVDYTQSPVKDNLTQIAGSGPDKIYIERITTSRFSYSNKVQLSANNDLQPGTYTNFDIACDVNLAGGVYVIDGGTLKINGGVNITGTGVMFVLKNGASVDINGGGGVYLTPMTKTELIAVGVSADDADKMENMLIFEDPNSPGSTGSKITGNANFDLNGVVYMPNSDLTMAGTMSATAECLMVASKTLQISGSADLTTLCPAGKTHDIVVGEGRTRVRLVL